MATVTPSPETRGPAGSGPGPSLPPPLLRWGGQKLPKEGSRRRVLCTQDLILERRDSVPQARLVITLVPGCWLGWASGQPAPDSGCAPPPHRMPGCYALPPSSTCPACQLGQASPLSLTRGHPHFMPWQNGNSSTKNLVGQLQGATWQDHLGVPAVGLGRRERGKGRERAALDGGQHPGQHPAGLQLAGTMGLGPLPGLRVWCHRPSKGAFLPVEDPAGRVETLGGHSASSKPCWLGRPRLQAPVSRHHSSPSPPNPPGPFFHPRKPRGGRGLRIRLKRKRQRRPRWSPMHERA